MIVQLNRIQNLLAVSAAVLAAVFLAASMTAGMADAKTKKSKVVKGPAGLAFYNKKPKKMPKQHGRLIWQRKATGAVPLKSASSTRTILYTSKTPAGKLVTVSGTVSTSLPFFDARLRQPDFLDSDAQPEAFFVASSFRFEGERLAEVRGEFTLRGLSQPLSLTALRFACRQDPQRQRDVCGGDFEARFNRSDFGSTFGLPFVGDSVRLLVQVEGVRR